MLLGSAALGALALGDAPPVSPFMVPIPPIVSRRPSGHNIGISSGPVFPAVFGSLVEIPPQLNEPGVTLYFSAGAGDLSTALLVFTKPSGAIYSVAAPLIYVGKPTATFAGGNFQGGTYIVYTFATDELNELGVWQVAVSRGSGGGSSSQGSFMVVRNVSM